jgi:hypothetical protein
LSIPDGSDLSQPRTDDSILQNPASVLALFLLLLTNDLNTAKKHVKQGDEREKYRDDERREREHVEQASGTDEAD